MAIVHGGEYDYQLASHRLLGRKKLWQREKVVLGNKSGNIQIN
jgi:hypothetical protein